MQYAGHYELSHRAGLEEQEVIFSGFVATQATFLRGSSSGGDAEGELAAELNALSIDELETRCRRNGLSRR